MKILVTGGAGFIGSAVVRLAVRRCATLWTGKKPIVDVTVIKATA